MDDSTDYDVTIKTYPEGQTCSVENGSGTVEGADVTDVLVSCHTVPLGGECPDGSISYMHDLDMDYLGFHQDIIVTGSVPFTCDDEGNFSGSGTLIVTVSGTITSPCDYTEYEGTASINVTLTGNFTLSELVFNMTETWYVGSPTASGTSTDTCGDEVRPFSYPLLETTNNYPLPFPNIDGHTITQPFSGASGSGNYNWTLHIN